MVLKPVVDLWHEPYGMLGMDVLQKMVTVSDGTHLTFWPRLGTGIDSTEMDEHETVDACSPEFFPTLDRRCADHRWRSDGAWLLNDCHKHGYLSSIA